MSTDRPGALVVRRPPVTREAMRTDLLVRLDAFAARVGVPGPSARRHAWLVW